MTATAKGPVVFSSCFTGGDPTSATRVGLVPALGIRTTPEIKAATFKLLINTDNMAYLPPVV